MTAQGGISAARETDPRTDPVHQRTDHEAVRRGLRGCVVSGLP